jgi:hypothetical protein
MIIVANWQDSDVIDKDVKSCDNKEIGGVKEINQSYLVVRKGDAFLRVPRSAVGTYNDGKIYLRASEAEVLSGVYPFLDSEKVDASDKVRKHSPDVTLGPVVPQST